MTLDDTPTQQTTHCLPAFRPEVEGVAADLGAHFATEFFAMKKTAAAAAARMAGCARCASRARGVRTLKTKKEFLMRGKIFKQLAK